MLHPFRLQHSLFFTLLLFQFVCIVHVHPQEASDDSISEVRGIEPVFISFSHVYHDMQADSSMFDQEKVSFGARFTLNDYWSGNIWIDFLKDPGEPAYLKPAHLTYRNSNFKMDVGLFFLSQWRIQQRYWQNRYIHESFQSYYDLGWSADVGVRGTYTFNKLLKADVAVVNGDGYKKPGIAFPLKYGAAAYITPVDEALFKIYYDFYPEDVRQNTLSVFVNYGESKKYTLSAEYNFKNGLEHIHSQAHGFSGYSNVHITDYIGIFFRYDQIWYEGALSTNQEPLRDNNHIILSGMQYELFANLRVAATYKRMEYLSYDSDNIIQLSIEYRTP